MNSPDTIRFRMFSQISRISVDTSLLATVHYTLYTENIASWFIILPGLSPNSTVIIKVTILHGYWFRFLYRPNFVHQPDQELANYFQQ